MNFTKNIGEKDRTIRLIAGAVLIFLGIVAQNGLAFIGILVLATAYFRTDPIYSMMGISTLPKDAGVVEHHES